MEAGRLIGELHALLQAQYIDPESEESQKALNILCVRLVFCLFCEDAELFPKDALLNYLRNVEPKNCVSSRGFEQKEHRKLSSLSIGSAHAF